MSKKSLWNGKEWVKGSVIKKEVVTAVTLNSSKKVEKLINNNLFIINQLHKEIEHEKNFIASKCSKNKKRLYVYQDFKKAKDEDDDDVTTIKSRHREKTEVKLAQENITKLFTKIIMLS